MTGLAWDASLATRVADVLRDIARGGLAGAIAGTAIGGIGGRVLMTIAAVLNPDATGIRTENGELVGVFTLNGTLALIIFGGLLGGLVASVVWVVASPWIPGSTRQRAVLAFIGAIALGAFFVVQSTNTDFIILQHDALLIALFTALVGLIGAGIALVDERLDRRMPRPGPAPGRLIVGYGILAFLGVPALVVTVQSYFDGAFGTARPPFGVGWALLVVGLVTATWWAVRIATRRQLPQLALVAAARIALVVALVLGAAHFIADVGRIL